MDRETTAQIAKRLLNHLDEGSTDFAPGILSMGVDKYFDPETAADERRLVFGANPFVAAHANELPKPGDFVTTEYLGTSILVVRQDDGGIRAFSNVCRHRGARVEFEERGNRRMFSCNYHRWCYKRDGALKTLPHAEGFEGMDRSDKGLIELPCEELFGLVWVISAPGAPLDLRSDLGPELVREIDETGLTAAVPFRAETFALNMNWKLVMDGFLDTYHLAFLHPTTVGPFFHGNMHVFDQWGKTTRLIVARKSIDAIRDASPEDIDLPRHTIFNYTIYPTTVLVCEPEHFEIWSIAPAADNPNRSHATLRLLVPEEPTTDKARAFWNKNWAILVGAVENEDWWIAQSVAAGLRHGHVPEVVYGRNEPAAQFLYGQIEEDLRSMRQ
jgi:phenylpropionate dioxygenase-like ring-hydroxylating dioxygenase large terminal subunit